MVNFRDYYIDSRQLPNRFEYRQLIMFWNFLDNSEPAWRGIWPYIGVALLAGAKFFAGMAAALIQQFTLLEMMLTVCLGGCAGVLVYTYLPNLTDCLTIILHDCSLTTA